MIKLLDSENLDYNLTSLTTVLTHTPSAASPMRCQVLLKIGDGSKDLDGSGGAFDIGITVGGVKVEPYPEAVYFATRDSGDSARLAWWSQEFPVVANDAVTVTLMSPNAADTDVDVVAYLYDVNAVDVIAVSGDTTAADNLETACDGGAYNLGGGSIVAASVTAEVSADVTKVSGDATAANNLELMYDGTGYTDATAPASRSQLSNLAVTGAAVNTIATSAVLTTGTQASGTYVSTAANDSVRHTITDVGNAIDIYYEFSVGGDGVPTGVAIDGYLLGQNDILTVYGYDWVTGWIAIGSYAGGAAVDASRTYPLFTSMVGSGADLGKVRVRFYAASGLSTASLNIDQIYVQYAVVNRSVGYQNGAIWIDTVNGTAGTTAWINGTADNPVDSLADATTLSTALNLTSFHLAVASEITFTVNHENTKIFGGGTIHLGGYSVAGTIFEDMESIDGIGTGDYAIFMHCGIGDMTIPNADFHDCHLTGTITSISSSTYEFINCVDSAVGAGSNATFVFTASVDAMFRAWKGGLQLDDMASTNSSIIDGAGRIIIDASSTGGSITLRGFFPYSTGGDDFVAAGGTLVDDQAYSEGLVADAVWDESITSHGDSGTTGDALATIDSNVNSILTDTETTIPDQITALNDLSAAEVNAECDSAIADAEPVDANVIQIGGVVQSLTDLKDFVDTGYDPSTHKVAGVVLADNLTQIASAAASTQIQADVQAVVETNNLDHLCKTATAAADMTTEVADNTVMSRVLANGDTSGFDPSTDGLQPIRDRGDTAWITGGGTSLTDILNVSMLVPLDIDLANTATYRTGLMLINALDDLPSTAEIAPGTIDIDRKAIGGTSWVSVISGAACSEAAGLIYYDEVFDAGTGYVEGDSIRITFKGQKITVAANDYEISDSTGRMCYTNIRQTMRGTDSAALSTDLATHDGKLDTVDANVDLALEDTAELQGNQGNWLTATGFATSGALTTHDGKLDTVDANVDLILEDTGTTIPATITTLQGTTTKLEGMFELDGAVYKFTANALEEAAGDATLANQALILEDIEDMKGTGFVKDTNSLVDITPATPIHVTVETTVVE